jgi:hypothetical protein
MAQFPRTEAEIITALQALIAGLTENPTVFPAPPVSAVEAQAVLDSLLSIREECNAHDVARSLLTQVRGGAAEEGSDVLKVSYDYGETVTAPTYAQLPLIGWDTRKAPSAIEVPGQARALEIKSQGEGWVFLDWKSPNTGGKVASYRIERRERPAGDWAIIDVAITSEIMLGNQERAKDWEYRVVSLNTTGEGIPSNTVAAVV